MDKTRKNIEFTAKNVKAFTGWLKRFSTIDNSLLLEIDQAKATFVAKTYNEEHSVVKMSSISFEDAGFVCTKENKDLKRIRVGIYNIPRLIKIIDQFNDVEFTFTVQFQEMITEGDTQYAAEELFFKNKFLKMNTKCASISIFKPLTDEAFQTGIAAIDSFGSFEFTKANIDKINTLIGLDDTDEECLLFTFYKKEVNVAGKTFDLSIANTKSDKETELKVFKNLYSTLDGENYNVELGEDRLVFNSKDSETTSVISKAEDK
jgi:hypothetical protein